MMMVNGATRAVRQLKTFRDELIADANALEATAAERRAEWEAMRASMEAECAEDASFAENLRARAESMDMAIAALEKINAH